jgi:hypothetical protein
MQKSLCSKVNQQERWASTAVGPDKLCGCADDPAGKPDAFLHVMQTIISYILSRTRRCSKRTPSTSRVECQPRID